MIATPVPHPLPLRQASSLSGHCGDLPAAALPLLSLEDLAIGHRRSDCVQRGLSGQFDAGSLTAIVGANGSGKSTLLKTLVGQLPALEGQVHCRVARADIGYLPQLDEIDRRFPMTVCDFVALGHWRRASWWRSLRRAPWQALTLDAIHAVGLRGLEGRWIDELSGGQFQRVRFARLLVEQAPLVLLDEPFSGIDSQTVDDLLCLIHQWHQQGTTVIAVLHDMTLVRRHFPRTLALAPPPGVAVWGATDQVLDRPLHGLKRAHGGQP
ncbi:MAG: Iron(3+)-hydroxamate import ATP-binding protein FhuC [Paracidovorax wautersii]|uniref:Iron(3+)-hydroxamate import ATP-binding protein FhuC n=1 Tax=Paracidovorax wautersii TaxID=1177982 RepID=A0A7V8FLW1_9BURK|nr:MAG: Iron(3+)-hydroxamate import ATP-binding protein FhuC [Paracidovorax wautersii]